jgi:hypothetical protein
VAQESDKYGRAFMNEINVKNEVLSTIYLTMKSNGICILDRLTWAAGGEGEGVE